MGTPEENPANSTRPRRHWIRLTGRFARLLLHQPERSANLITASYDNAAATYDTAWTGHMRDLSLQLLDALGPIEGAEGIDLGCGTGFLTAELARRTAQRTLGVDRSAGMLGAARQQNGQCCDFREGDIVEFLRVRASRSADVITCGWALGYTRPLKVVQQIARVLRPGGQVAIIDNTLLSLVGVMWASLKTFAEQPQALRHVLRVRFLPHSLVLGCLLRFCGLGVRYRFDGRRTYCVPDGQAAIDRLHATGAAAGFEFAAEEKCHRQIFTRFADTMNERGTGGVEITHRYLGAVGIRNK